MSRPPMPKASANISPAAASRTPAITSRTCGRDAELRERGDAEDGEDERLGERAERPGEVHLAGEPIDLAARELPDDHAGEQQHEGDEQRGRKRMPAFSDSERNARPSSESAAKHDDEDQRDPHRAREQPRQRAASRSARARRARPSARRGRRRPPRAGRARPARRSERRDQQAGEQQDERAGEARQVAAERVARAVEHASRRSSAPPPECRRRRRRARRRRPPTVTSARRTGPLPARGAGDPADELARPAASRRRAAAEQRASRAPAG